MNEETATRIAEAYLETKGIKPIKLYGAIFYTREHDDIVFPFRDHWSVSFKVAENLDPDEAIVVIDAQTREAKFWPVI